MRFSALIKSVAACGLLAVGSGAQALALTPGDADGTGTGAADCEPGCVTNAFPGSSTPLTLYYKGEAVTGNEEGTFAASYETIFLDEPNDPSGATISWLLGTPTIECPECYLAVKDGNQNPSYYFFDLSGWDGMETITLSDFWPAQGAISHVSIWGFLTNGGGGGGGTPMPLPGTVALLGLGLLAAGFARRRKA